LQDDLLTYVTVCTGSTRSVAADAAGFWCEGYVNRLRSKHEMCTFWQEFCVELSDKASVPASLILILSRLCYDLDQSTIGYLVFLLVLVNRLILRYGDSVDDTVEDNSSIFSLM